MNKSCPRAFVRWETDETKGHHWARPPLAYMSPNFNCQFYKIKTTECHKWKDTGQGAVLRLLAEMQDWWFLLRGRAGYKVKSLQVSKECGRTRWESTFLSCKVPQSATLQQKGMVNNYSPFTSCVLKPSYSSQLWFPKMLFKIAFVLSPICWILFWSMVGWFHIFVIGIFFYLFSWALAEFIVFIIIKLLLVSLQHVH